eukprot:4772908-Amphidinium_carterae.1
MFVGVLGLGLAAMLRKLDSLLYSAVPASFTSVAQTCLMQSCLARPGPQAQLTGTMLTVHIQEVSAEML